MSDLNELREAWEAATKAVDGSRTTLVQTAAHGRPPENIYSRATAHARVCMEMWPTAVAYIAALESQLAAARAALDACELSERELADPYQTRRAALRVLGTHRQYRAAWWEDDVCEECIIGMPDEAAVPFWPCRWAQEANAVIEALDRTLAARGTPDRATRAVGEEPSDG